MIQTHGIYLRPGAFAFDARNLDEYISFSNQPI